jgi:hypothetical protein
MPDPLLYLRAVATASVVCALAVLAITLPRRPTGAGQPAGMGHRTGMGRLNAACVFGMGLGLTAGGHMLGWRWPWPPASGLDRLLICIVPAVLGIELLAGFERVPRPVAWALRVGLAVATPWIVLHGSVYLSGEVGGWSAWRAVAALTACGAMLAGIWGFLARLSRRTPGMSIPLAICLSILCSGLTVMMAGYIKGGAAALPVAAVLVAATLSSWWIARRPGATATAIVGLGVVSLFGLLFVGRYFGRLSTGSALVMLLAPLLCWVSELSCLRCRKPWVVGAARIALVAIPLAVVLLLAWRVFELDMRPLLGSVQARLRSELVDWFVREEGLDTR